MSLDDDESRKFQPRPPEPIVHGVAQPLEAKPDDAKPGAGMPPDFGE